MFPLELLPSIEQNPENFALLERIPFTCEGTLQHLPLVLTEAMPNERVIAVVFVDIETTGTAPESDRIIKLSLVRCTVSLDRKQIISIDRLYGGYEDPKFKIPAEATELNGINNAMVQGQSFNMEEALGFFSDPPLAIAFNAKFVRPFFDRRFTSLSKLAWASVVQEINWADSGFNGRKLEYIVQSAGYFYDVHKGNADGLALCNMLYLHPEAMASLLDNSLRNEYKIEAVDAPYEVKDKLKEKGYRWDPDAHVWNIRVYSPEDVAGQIAELSSLYAKAVDSAKVTLYTAQDRYRV